MAVVPASGRTVPLYVLIIFIVLFLLATTGLVLLFVNQESLRQEAEEARTAYNDYVGAANKPKLESFRAMGKEARPPMTAVGALLQDRATLAQMMSGNSTATSKEVTEKVNAFIDSLNDPSLAKLKETAKTDMVGAFRQATEIVKNKTAETANLSKELAECQKSKDTVVAGYAELESKFNANTEKVNEQLTSLSKIFESYKNEFSTQLEQIKSQVSEDQKAKLEQLAKKQSRSVDEIRDLVRRNLQVLIKSSAELGSAEQRSKVNMSTEQLMQQADGEVLDLSGLVAYINVGSKQGIKAGVRFVVASPEQKGQFQPAIKAVLEVTSVSALTAEAQVVASIPSNPILKGDILYNLVYNRNAPLNFFVMGDFDVNQDGIIDPNGTQRVNQIISLAGGVVAKQLSPAVNFVIMGKAPKAPQEAQGENENAGDAGSENQKKAKKYQQFNDLKEQIQSLGIPVISESEFLKYTGYMTNLTK